MSSTIQRRIEASPIAPWAIARKLLKRLPVIILITVAAVGLTAAYVFSVPSVYTAWTRIVIDPGSRRPFEDATAPSLIGSETLGLDTQLLIASSSVVIEPVVSQFNLVDDPEFMGGAPDASPEQRLTRTMENLSKAVSIVREGATYIVSIGVKSQTAEKAADLSQAIAESYLREQQEFQLSNSMQLAAQIDGSLVGLRERVREAEQKVQAFRAENKLQSTVDGTLLVGQELAGLNAKLVEARSALASASAANDEIQRYLEGKLELTALGEIVSSPRMTQLLDEYARAARAEASLASNLLPQHPILGKARAEVTLVQSLIRDEIQAISASKQVELDVARERVNNIETEMGSLRVSADVSEQDLIVLRELETEAKSTREVYENVLSRAKQVANLEQITMPAARIISPAQPPQNPSWPRKGLLLALAATIGLFAGVIIVLAEEVWTQVRPRLMPPPVRPANLELPPTVLIRRPKRFSA